MLADNCLFLTNSVWSSDINDGSSFSKHKASVFAIFSTQQLVEKLIWARGFFFPLLRIRKPCISKHRKGHGWLPQIYSLSQNSQGVLGTESPSSTLCSPYYWSRVCNYEAAILPALCVVFTGHFLHHRSTNTCQLQRIPFNHSPNCLWCQL